MTAGHQGWRAISKRIKVVHVITGLNIGGAERLLETLIARSERDCFAHEVISLTSMGVVGRQMLEVGVQVLDLGLPSVATALRRIGAVRSSLRSADVVHTWMYHANLIGGALRPRGRPLLWSLHATELEARHTNATTRLMVAGGRWLSGLMPEKVVCCSQSSQDYHARLGYDMSHALVINNGIDTKRFQSSSINRQHMREAWGLEGKLLIGNVARWHPQKDHLSLLRAFAAARRRSDALHLVLCGEGLTKDNRELMDSLRVLDIEEHVLLLGPTRDVPAVLAGLDLFAMSSAFGEALPLALCEAMACELPAIVTDVGECAAVVSGSGWVVPPARTDLFTAALVTAASATAAERTTMGRQARARVLEQFDIETSARQYQELYLLLHRDKGHAAHQFAH